MSSYNLHVFIPVVLSLAIAVIAFYGAIIVGRLLRPFKPSPVKNQAYECGENPVGTAWSFFNIRFYVIGLIFIIFDVENVLMFPVASVFKKMNEIGQGGLVLAEILIFISILVAGIAYCWRKGDFDWVKSYQIKNGKK